MEWMIVLVVIVILRVVVRVRNMDASWTQGSNFFKDSEYNLEKDKNLDPSDYDYYNKKGKMK